MKRNHESGAFPIHEEEFGLTKHEYAAILIAQGLVTKYNLKEPGDQKIVAQMAYELSAEVLNQFK